MKKTFKEYHGFTPTELTKLWDEAIIVLDTNVLLDFYAFGDTTLSDYFKVLKEVKKRSQLWMPNRIGYEFFENRVGIISKQLNQYDNVLKKLDSPKELIAKLSETSITHAHLDFNKIAEDYEAATKDLKDSVGKLKDKHPDHLGTDKVLTELEKVYTDSIVGKEYSEEQTAAIIKEGEERYAKKIPPGFKDQDKDDDDKPYANRKYGDLIIWKQMIDQAKATKKPIIFVTNDAKDDWVQYAKGHRKLGPKPALKKEMLKEAKVDFELYSSDEFLDHTNKFLKLNLNRDSVSEVKKYRKLESERVSTISYPNVNHGLIHSSTGLYSGRYQRHRLSIHHSLERALSQVHSLQENWKNSGRASYSMLEVLSRVHHLYEEIYDVLRHTSIAGNSEYTYRFVKHLSRMNDDLRNYFDDSNFEIADLITTNKRIIAYLTEDL